MATHIQIGKDFILLASPNNVGISRAIDVINQTGDNLKFNVTNGSNYSRATSYLYENYYLIKEYENGTIDTKRDTQRNAGVGLGKLKTIRLNGKKF